MSLKMIDRWPGSKKAQGSGVSAGSVLVKGLRSRIFSIEDLKEDLGPLCDKFQVESVKGYLEICSKVPMPNWCKLVKFATDIHSANIHIFIIQNNLELNGTFYLEIVKNIERGEELYLWFSEEFSALLDVPFLAPKNIIGHKKYRCHICDENYENPNPLKLHLFLSCGKDSQIVLWQSIVKVVDRKLSIIHRNSMHSPPHRLLGIQQLSSDPPSSAFIPYKKSPRIDISPGIQPLNLTVGPPPQSGWVNNVLDMKLSNSIEVSNNYAADVELFASNWGKLKHGHLCVYCGKVYSRKYGLKIHIRTHTGYKPLKCKYCLRPFGDPSNLNKHVRLHANGLTQYGCSICGKVLVRRRDLERHLKSQHDSDANSLLDIHDTSSD